MRHSTSIVTAVFGIAFAAIANLAWATAASTSGPWYSPTVSLQMYSVSLGVAAILAMIIAIVASGHASRTDEALRDLNRQIAIMRGPSRSVEDSLIPRGGSIEFSLDDVLQELDAGGAETTLVAEKLGHDGLVQLSSVPAAERREILRGLIAQRMVLQSLLSRVRIAVAGPLLGSVLFVAISASMLIGAEGFAQRNYQLNTALLLLLGYGWPVLVAWGAAAMMLLHGPSGRRTP